MESRGFSAQKRYWNSLVKSQKQALSKAWGKTLKQSDKIFSSRQTDNNTRKSKQIDHDKHVGARIGEASHPGPRMRAGRKLSNMVKVWTCNTGGAPKAWNLLPLFSEHKPDIVFLQEVNFKSSEWKAFLGQVQNAGYHGFYSGTNSPQPAGEVAVSVRKCLPCRPAWICSSKGGAGQLVWLGGYLVGSVYLAPNPDSMQVCEEITQAMHCIGPQCGWFLGGDFNAEPSENPFLHTLADLQVQEWDPGVPARWSGDRCIDYFVSNRCASETMVLQHEIADHCIVQSQVNLRLPKVEAWTQSPVVRLPSLIQFECSEEV